MRKQRWKLNVCTHLKRCTFDECVTSDHSTLYSVLLRLAMQKIIASLQNVEEEEEEDDDDDDDVDDDEFPAVTYSQACFLLLR